MTRFSRAYAATLAAAQEAKRAITLKSSRPPESATRKMAADNSPSGEPPGATALKYGNVQTDGYASKREAKRAAELKLLAKAGKIRRLREQVPFLLIPEQDGERKCEYVCDFVYEELRAAPFGTEWIQICEDAKGYRTREWVIKRKLMLFVHHIKVIEV